MKLIVILWIVCGIVGAIAARANGKKGFGWFLLGVILGPLSFIVAASASKGAPEPETAAGESEAPAVPEEPPVRAEALEFQEESAPQAEPVAVQEETEVPVEAPAVQEASSAAAETVAKCPRCAQPLAPDTDNCRYCGSELGNIARSAESLTSQVEGVAVQVDTVVVQEEVSTPAQAMTKCPRCAQLVPADAGDCRYCGSEVGMVAREKETADENPAKTKCPRCAEWAEAAAATCRYCGVALGNPA